MASDTSPPAPVPLRFKPLPWIAVFATTLAMPLAFSFRFDSFLDAKLAALVLAIPLFIVGGARPVAAMDRRVAIACCLAFLGIVLHTMLVSAVPSYSFERATQLVLVFAAAAYVAQTVRTQSRYRIETLLITSATMVGALALLQYAHLVSWLFPVIPGYDQPMYSVFGNQDLLGGYLAVGVVLLAGSAGRASRITAPALVATAILVAALALSGSRSAWLAGALGTLATLVQIRSYRRRNIAILIVGVALLVPVSMLNPSPTWDRVRSSFGSEDVGYRARLWIWDGTLRMIADHPIAGVGIGNYAYHSPRYLGEALIGNDASGHYSNTLHTLHAHSDPLEIVTELGAPGVLLIAGLAGFLWRKRRAHAAPGLFAYGVFAAVNTTWHSPAHLLTAFLLVATVASGDGDRVRNDGDAMQRRIRIPRIALSRIALAMAVAVTYTTLVPSALLANAQLVYEESPEEAEVAYERALKWPWPSYRAEEDLAILLLNDGRNAQAFAHASRAAKGIDTGRIHLVLGRAARNLDDMETAGAHYESCLRRWPFYEPAWEDLHALRSPESWGHLRDELGSDASP